METEKNEGKAGRPGKEGGSKRATFRLAIKSISQLKALAKASGDSQAVVIEKLVNRAHQKLI